MTKRLLAVHPHPDDEVPRGGATIAHYAARGVETVLVTCTDGAAGEVLNPAFTPPPGVDPTEPAGLAVVRSAELERSAHTLGFRRVHRLGFADSGPTGDCGGEHAFARIPLELPTAALAELLERERPDVIVGYGPRHARDPHPDHLRAHEVLTAAVARAVPDAAVFWVAFSLRRHRALSARCVDRGAPDPYAAGVAFGASGFDDDEITTRVPLDPADTARRTAALRCHESQVSPGSGWFALDEADLHEAYPYDEYVQVRPTRCRAHDLFPAP